MHPLSIDEKSRWPVYFLAACAASALSWGLHTYLGDPPWFADVPVAPFALYALLLGLMDRVFWQFRLFKWLGVAAPSICGTWQGTVTSSHDRHGTPHQVTVKIKQTWTSLLVQLEGDNSKSESFTASYVSEPDPVIYYVYRNEPKSAAVETMHPHRGSAYLRIVGRGQLEGEYFSGRDRETHGTLTLRRNA